MGKCSKLYEFSKSKLIDNMQIKANTILNPKCYHLSAEAKKRLKWMYLIHYEYDGNIKMAANNIGVSRTWLSIIHSQWERCDRDPRSLEPRSKAPLNTTKRKRIEKNVENKIVALRKKHVCWGKEKISTALKRDEHLTASPSTVNRYLLKHDLINPSLSEKNKRAWAKKKEQVVMKQKLRPPSEVKDYKPGALVEKDMKLILKPGSCYRAAKFKAKENFWYQHTLIDSFTRLRALGLASDANSRAAVAVQVETVKRLPFAIAAINTDNGGENGKDFDQYLNEKNIVHFFSRSGTPTDNPRVERSHLTDEIEYYGQGNIQASFEKQAESLKKWENEYNYIRPHQALGYLTPMEFYKLWKEDPENAYAIKDKYAVYLKKNALRLKEARKMKKKKDIEEFMNFIDRRLAKKP